MLTDLTVLVLQALPIALGQEPLNLSATRSLAMLVIGQMGVARRPFQGIKLVFA